VAVGLPEGRGRARLLDEEGEPKYGLHALRHFFASWAIERDFSAKRVQALLGHSSIQMTFDRYGHLFPSLEDDHAKFAPGELAAGPCDKEP
jgi:integrase